MMRKPRLPDADIAKARETLLRTIAQSAGSPCPTNGWLGLVSGLNDHEVRAQLRVLARMRHLWVETRARRGGAYRRMRAVGARWTDWTVREAYPVVGSVTPDHVVLYVKHAREEARV